MQYIVKADTKEIFNS